MSRQPRILIVDDSEVVIEVATGALLDAGFEVVSRTQAIGTGAVVVREQPDLLLVDIAMPMLGGQALIDMLRKNPSSRSLPVLIYSDRPVAELQKIVTLSGAEGYVAKSSDTKPLVQKVRETLAAHSKTRDYVLFVDDDEILLSSLRRLVRNSVNAEFTTSGFAALRRILSSSPPRIVVSDIVLGDLSGEHLFLEAQKKDASWSQRFIFVSGAASASSTAWNAIEASRAPLFAKPVSTASLLEQMQRMGMQRLDQ